ncbi:glycoside hydrolase family 76 protein [Arachidicoccus ginsenosidivorans]
MKIYIVSATFLLLGCIVSSACNHQVNKKYVLDYDIVPAYHNEDTWKAYDAFNQYLLDPVTSVYKVNNDIADGANSKSTIGAIWTQAIYWDMAMNAYKLAEQQSNTQRATQYKQLVADIYKGDSAHYVGFDFDNQDPNDGWFIYDDIMWWTISFSRAYGLFKDPQYLKRADESFCRVWYGSYKLKDRGSYDKVNGGMFWQWNNQNPPDNSGTGKMSCINFPAVIAAATLYNNIAASDVQHQADDKIGFDGNPDYPRWLSRDTYLKNAKEIYEWGVNNLFDKGSGNVADSRHENSVDWHATLYNQGTFIGASCILYKITGEQSYLDNAILAANYTMNVMSAPLFILPNGGGTEQGIYTAIFAQYMQILIKDCEQTDFLPWMERSIGYGWNNRNDKNLTIKDYTKKAGPTVSCYDASGIPALMLLFPSEK